MKYLNIALDRVELTLLEYNKKLSIFFNFHYFILVSAQTGSLKGTESLNGPDTLITGTCNTLWYIHR